MSNAHSTAHLEHPACQVVVIVEPAKKAMHDVATLYSVAERLALLLHGTFAGARNVSGQYIAPRYFVPADTLLEREAKACGIVSEQQLFGGVVPYPFMATKAISHAVVSPLAAAPHGWSFVLGDTLVGQVLPGYTAFTRADALRAGKRLLAQGPVRIKSTRGIGGSGQSLVHDRDELAQKLAEYDEVVLQETGVVLEQHLENVVTYSVGSVHVGKWELAYCGLQRITRDRARRERYGGSDLTFFQADMRALPELWDRADAHAQMAIAQAIGYDQAISAAYPALLASRRNYDIGQGHTASGVFCSGVFEQSWRIGGASPAEVAALEVFSADEQVRSVRASTHEVYALIDPPPHATVSFRGEDPHLGALTKYSVVEDNGHPAT